MNAIEILEKELMGSFITEFSVGDILSLIIGGKHLVSQNIVCNDEDFVNDLIYDKYRPSDEAVDKGYISKSAIIAASMRKEVIKVILDDLGNLTLQFENECELLFPSNEKTVDWQWCLNSYGSDPYKEYIIACFSQDQILISEKYH